MEEGRRPRMRDGGVAVLEIGWDGGVEYYVDLGRGMTGRFMHEKSCGN